MKRKKPLRRNSQPLKRTQLRRTAIRAKPRVTGWVKGRYVATRAEWDEILRLKLGPCRVCGGTLRPSLHHLVERDDFGGDFAENLIPLCGSGTTGCHGIYTSHHRSESLDGQLRTWKDVAWAIRRNLRDEEIKHVIETAGAYYLEKRYPLENSL